MTRGELVTGLKGAVRSLAVGAGPRLVATSLTLLIIASVSIFCWLRGVPDLSAPSAAQRVGSFVITYWRTHPLDGALLLVTIIIFGCTPLVDWIVSLISTPDEIDTGDYSRRVLFIVGSALLAAATAILAAVVLPFFDLEVQAVIRRLLVVLYLGSAGLAYYFGLIQPRCHVMNDPLTHLTFGPVPTFNIAAGGASSVEAERARRVFLPVGDRVTADVQTQFVYGSTDSVSQWTGLDDFFDRLGRLLEVPANSIMIHERTASAIGAALDFLTTDKTICVSTDLDYPTVESAIAARAGVQHVRVECAADAWSLNLSGRAIANRVAVRVEQLLNRRRNFVVCVPHITYETGVCVDIDALAQRLRTVPNVHLVVDGAQAVGNIAVTGSLLQNVSFYAFGGHKWLMGEPTLGILYANETLISRPSGEIAAALVGSRAFAYSKQDFTAAADTVSLPPFITLNVTLIDMLKVGIHNIDKHNTSLACLFRGRLAPLGVGRLPQFEQRGGIVTIIVHDARAVASQLSSTADYTAQALRNDDALRFGFHYNVGERDVHNLAFELGRIVYASRRKRYA